MSEFLGTDLDDETVEKIAKHCTFDNLKNVKSFDLSVRIKSMNNAIPFKIMRVSYHSKVQILCRCVLRIFPAFQSKCQNSCKKNWWIYGLW